MSDELQTAAAASVGGIAGRDLRRAPPTGTPCPNCATPLLGPWCYACGQLGEDFHRSIGRLGAEAMEGIFHLDGRLWRTLPDLMLNPGRLTRAFLDGHRAPQIPPLRLFLLVLLAIFVIGGLTGGSKPAMTTVGGGAGGLVQMSSQEQSALNKQLLKWDVRWDAGHGKSSQAVTGWLRDRLIRTLADPERFYLILQEWAERFAFLMLPISAILLGILFIFQRRFFFFDHTIFSLHSLSAVGLLLILAMSLGPLSSGRSFLLLMLAPLHLFAHMRGVYRTSVVGTLIRMVLLFFGTVVWALILILGLLAVGLNSMAA